MLVVLHHEREVALPDSPKFQDSSHASPFTMELKQQTSERVSAKRHFPRIVVPINLATKTINEMGLYMSVNVSNSCSEVVKLKPASSTQKCFLQPILFASIFIFNCHCQIRKPKL